MVQILSMQFFRPNSLCHLVRYTCSPFSDPLYCNGHESFPIRLSLLLLVYQISVFQHSVLPPYKFRRSLASRHKAPQTLLAWRIHELLMATSRELHLAACSLWKATRLTCPRHFWIYYAVGILFHFSTALHLFNTSMWSAECALEMCAQKQAF